MGRDYECGDVCLDLTGCPQCPNQIKDDLLESLKKMERDSLVIYISCTLEYMLDLKSTIKELERVSGSPENLFIVNVEPYSPLHFLFDGSRNIIYDGPPNVDKINWYRVPNSHKVLHKIYGPISRMNMKGVYS